MTTIRIIDLETQSHEHLGRKGSPYCDKNYIVMPGWRDDIGGVPGEVQDRYFKSRAEAESTEWFNLDGVDILVAHNAMFEMSWFFTRHRDEFLKFLRRGGRVLCTQLAEYLLSHQTWTYPALDEVAPKHGGTHKVDGIKALWDQGVLTSEMDPAMLREYLSGPCGDVNNTALVFYSQMQMLQAKGMWRMYLERCEGMLAFSICEVSGLKIDREVADKNHAVQLAELAGIREELVKLVPTDLPDTLDFNWGSDYHMSALLSGGEVRYRKRVPYDPPKMEKGDCVKALDGAVHWLAEDISATDTHILEWFSAVYFIIMLFYQHELGVLTLAGGIFVVSFSIWMKKRQKVKSYKDQLQQMGNDKMV